MLVKALFIYASLSGATGVALGAFAAHSLKNSLDPRLLETFQTAVQYQMIHSLVLLAVAILLQQLGRSQAFEIAGYTFVLGILLFSGSLYGLVLTDMKWLGPVTPIGGLMLIIGWLALAVGGAQRLG